MLSTAGGTMPKSNFKPGEGKVLDHAAKAAYANATNEGGKPPFVIDRIELHGTNPFTEYKVFLKQDD
jgi:hypothetical protein